MLELYKDLIIDHGINPRNKYILKGYTHTAKGFNHFCGDTVNLYLILFNNYIKDVSFDGIGCSISMASASLLTLSLKNKTLDEAIKIFLYFKLLLRDDINKNEKFYNINILSHIKKFPSRVKCATLIWHTFNDILKHDCKN